MTPSILNLIAILFACNSEKSSIPIVEENIIEEGIIDADGDGYLSDEDCDDNSLTIHPGSPEICDGIDNNCDGQIDEGVQSTYYLDADGDDFGSPDTTEIGCRPSEDYVAIGTDCNDQNADVFPGAQEVCDLVDNDCNGQIDEGLGNFWYVDLDEDGYGDINSELQTCNPPEGYIEMGGDCDDSAAFVFPGAIEECDNIDNNCNGEIDETGSTHWYEDVDGDGFGNPSVFIESCFPVQGYIDNNLDCDDDDLARNPDVIEACDQIDNNCNGILDENAVDGATWYLDADMDGYGDVNHSVISCTQPIGYANNPDDCDDSRFASSPASLEFCNGIDDDCDGVPDDSDVVDFQVYFADTDGDSYGDPLTPIQACSQGAGMVVNNQDCNDSEASIHPNATEICNSIDDNCNTVVDEGAVGLGLYYQDNDGDGYGSSVSQLACAGVSGFATQNGDCDDTDPGINPGITEVCDFKDNDCDGVIDEGFPVSAWYPDADGDNYGANNSLLYHCEQPVGYVADDGDCNDTVASINPLGVEVCNGADDDCDGGIDETIPTTIWYQDNDGDGYGLSSVIRYDCQQPPGYTALGGDCDDTDPTLHPGVTEICNGLDDDCDGAIDEGFPVFAWYQDNDGDNFGSNSFLDYDCQQPAGYVSAAGDCDDSNAAIHPNATEICNLADDDCDGGVDEGFSISPWYIDADGDSFGSNASVSYDCQQPIGHVSVNGDCDDTDATIHPNAAEICNGLDDDCDGGIDEGYPISAWYVDADGDNYGSNSSISYDCKQAAGYVLANGDCNDSDASIHPGVSEVCNGFDDNCDGGIDEGFSVSPWYIDSDGDNYGANSIVDYDCQQPIGYVPVNGDCNDSDATINPTASEICNGADDDCDGGIDEGFSMAPWYIDSDGDNYGANSIVDYDCQQPVGYVSMNGDCNDSDATINPSATEICNGSDDDCDGGIDEGFSISPWYIDSDGDNYGANSSVDYDCQQPVGYVSIKVDCNDSDATINPAASEICNGADDDCDGGIDEGLSVFAWYLDSDGDSYGTAGVTEYNCQQPMGYVSLNGDCDDSDFSINPAATEVCNAIDDDCDGGVDEQIPTQLWYIDSDGDGFGNPALPTYNCLQPTGYVDNNGDCNDFDLAINPNATEICNGLDDDCDNTADAGHLGLDAVCVADSCLDILNAHPTASDRQYLIDFPNSGQEWTECDMNSFGGGWTLVFADDMSPPDAGWDFQTTTICGIWGEILGGYGVTSGPYPTWTSNGYYDGTGAVNNTISTRSISHSQVWAEMDYITMDTWDPSGGSNSGSNGDLAYVNFNGVNVWLMDADNHSTGLAEGGQICGWYRPSYLESSRDSRHYASTIQNGTYASFTLTVGSTLNQHPWDESFGVDNVYIWVR